MAVSPSEREEVARFDGLPQLVSLEVMVVRGQQTRRPEHPVQLLENRLWLKKVVKYSSYYKVYGTYSLLGERVGAGVPIRIERKTATKDWALVKTVYTNDLGAWNVTLSLGVKWWIRARAKGIVIYDEAEVGVDPEYSVTKVLYPL